MLLIGLTGGIGSGKSLVGEYFADLGAIVVDSDQLARDVVERGTPGYEELLSRFGDAVLTHGELDRRKLADTVFADPEARRDLEAIIHPRIRKLFDLVIAEADADAVIVNEIPLLHETQAHNRFDLTITVSAPEELRIKRAVERGMKEYQVRARMENQASDLERESGVDFVIENDGDKDDLLRQVENMWEEEILPRLHPDGGEE